MTTAHSSIEGNQVEPIPDGPRCAGCHTGNYDPQKAVPVSGAGTMADPYVYPPTVAPSNGAFSEGVVGCSTCHYGDGVPDGHAARGARERRSANADICGQCHSRYGYSKPPNDTYPLASPVPGGDHQPAVPHRLQDAR